MKEKKEKKPRLGLKIFLVSLSIVLILALGVFVFLYGKLGKVNYSDGSIKESISAEEAENMADELEVDTSELERTGDVSAPEGEAVEGEDILNILLLGTDDRSYELNENARADCIMVLSLNFADGTAKLMSFERGMGVEMYGGIFEGEVDLLTHCFRWGGAELMLKELQEYFKLDVDKYVRVNFAAFAMAVDALGGVDVELSAKEVGGMNGYSGSVRTGCYNAAGEYVTYSEHPQPTFTEGVNHLYGPAALAYARLRYIDSDWHRIERQRNLIQACADSLMGADLKTLNELLDSILPMVETNFTELELMELMLKAPKFIGVDIEQLTIPVDRETMGCCERRNGKGAFAPDYELNAEAIHEFLYGED